MRPPPSWRVRPTRRRERLRLLAALLVAFVAVVLIVRFHSLGDDPTPAPSQTNAACLGGGCAPKSGAEAPQEAAGQDAVGQADGEQMVVGAPAPSITGRAAAVVERACGALLYGLNAHERLPPASLAKIATALVAAERTRPTDQVDVQVNSALLASSTGSTVMGLSPGLRLTMNDLLHGLLLASGNDAAIAIAEHAAGSVPTFVELMNKKAGQLGLSNSHFTNPHGLDEPGLYTSAFDIAFLGRALLARPELAPIVRTEVYQPNWDGPPVWNGNELLKAYPGTEGVKIGYTEAAGQTIVAAAQRGDRRLIVSVLGGWDRYADAIALFEWAFANTKPACDG